MHPALPQTLTPENLAVWITENAIDSFTDKRPKPLTDEDVQEYEHKSSVASRELDKLKAIEDEFKGYIKDGSPTGDDGEPLPVTITIPATIGRKTLTEQREQADKILLDGQIVETQQLYTIPWPEGKKMVVFTIEGDEMEHLTKDMTQEQLEKHGNLFVQEAGGDMEYPVQDGPKEEDVVMPVVEEKPKKKKQQDPFI